METIKIKSHTFYLCNCETCNKILKIRRDRFRGKHKCKPCTSSSNLREKNPRWKGHMELSGTCWKHIKTNTKRKSRKLEFTITIEHAWEIYQKQKGRCALSNIAINFPQKVMDGEFPSLDRIDSNKGYIPGNIQWLHKDVNIMKWNLPQGRFLELCSLIHQNISGSDVGRGR